MFTQVGCGPQEEFRGCADISIGVDLPPAKLVSSICLGIIICNAVGHRFLFTIQYKMAQCDIEQYSRFFRYHQQPTQAEVSSCIKSFLSTIHFKNWLKPLKNVTITINLICFAHSCAHCIYLGRTKRGIST